MDERKLNPAVERCTSTLLNKNRGRGLPAELQNNENWIKRNITMMVDLITGDWAPVPHKLTAMQSTTGDAIRQEFLWRAHKTVANLREQLPATHVMGVCHERSSGSALEALRKQDGDG